jgi:hypothetical protein
MVGKTGGLAVRSGYTAGTLAAAGLPGRLTARIAERAGVEFDVTGKWYRTNEKENAIDYLETAAVFIAGSRRHKWKWVMITLHGALYGAAILAIVGTDPDSVLKGKKLISMWEALRRCENDAYMFRSAGSKRLVISDGERSSINKLSDAFRNSFEHFTPKLWSIQIALFPEIVRDVSRTIHFLFFESGNIRLTSPQRNRVVASSSFDRMAQKYF